MTNLPPPDPRSSRSTSLGVDEFLGIFVAFTIIGSILVFSLAKNRQGFKLNNLLSSSPSPSAQLTPTPTPEATAREAAPVSPVPTVDPTSSPESLTPVPSQSPIPSRIPAAIPLPAPISATPVPTTSARSINLVDVPQDFWARPFIEALVTRGIITDLPGGYFQPNQPVTRAEFAAMLKKAFDKKPTSSTEKFPDVPSQYWASLAIDEAYQTGFLKGYPENVFRPKQPIPRAQVLVALVTGLGLAPQSNSAQILSVYKDSQQIPAYAANKIASATQAGLVVNYPDPKLLKPTQNATRAEVAALIYQALVKEGKAEKTNSPHVIQP